LDGIRIVVHHVLDESCRFVELSEKEAENPTIIWRRAAAGERLSVSDGYGRGFSVFASLSFALFFSLSVVVSVTLSFDHTFVLSYLLSFVVLFL